MFLFDLDPAAGTAPSLPPPSFEARLAALRRGSRRVAYLYTQPDYGTFRYRVLNMVEALNTRGPDLAASYFFEAELDRVGPALDAADVLVLARMRYSGQLSVAVSRARSRGCRVLFDIDDLVFDPDYAHTLMDTLDEDTDTPAAWDYWFGHIARTGAAMKLCDRVLVTNDCLAAHVHRYAGLPAAVLPNFLNRAQMQVSASLFEAKRRARFSRDGRLHLGYFSGTPTHNRDFAIAAPALGRLLDRHAQLHLRIVGFLDPGPALRRHAARIEHHPLTDFLSLQRLIAQTEINLVPLQDNDFTDCKSELKYFEAAIVGTATVASPVFAYRRAIQPGVTGYLARSFDWDDTLGALIATPDALEPLASRACLDARDRYAWTAQLPAIERALFGP